MGRSSSSKKNVNHSKKISKKTKSDNEQENKKNIIRILIIIIILLLLLILLLLFNRNSFYNAPLIPNGQFDIFEIKCMDCTDIEVFDKDLIWQKENNLNIFSNDLYDNDSIISPLSTGIYEFKVKNSTSYNMVYDLKFNEENKYNINMKYRLKYNDKYIVGSENSWVSCNELFIETNRIDSDVVDSFILEWKWFESENDTFVGSIASDYSLSISITARQV